MRRAMLAMGGSVAVALSVAGACSSTTDSGGGGDAGAPGGGSSSAGGSGGACQGDVQQESFWPTLCAVATACQWVGPHCHPELGCTEDECNERHANDPSPSSYHPYLAAFESCVDDAASCLRCSALESCYGGPALTLVPCQQMVRCNLFDMTVAECQAVYLDFATSSHKFDSMCGLYCINELPADAPCADVEECAGACT